MPRPKDWDAPLDLASAAREAGVKIDFTDPDFQGFVEEHKWNEQEYKTQWKENNIEAERRRVASGEHDSAKVARKDWAAMSEPSKRPREIKPLPERSKDRDRDR